MNVQNKETNTWMDEDAAGGPQPPSNRSRYEEYKTNSGYVPGHVLAGDHFRSQFNNPQPV